jgi:hypothetical protein
MWLLQAMSRALGYVIVGFGGSVYGPIAMHLAAQLLFMDQQVLPTSISMIYASITWPSPRP